MSGTQTAWRFCVLFQSASGYAIFDTRYGKETYGRDGTKQSSSRCSYTVTRADTTKPMSSLDGDIEYRSLSATKTKFCVRGQLVLVSIVMYCGLLVSKRDVSQRNWITPLNSCTHVNLSL